MSALLLSFDVSTAYSPDTRGGRMRLLRASDVHLLALCRYLQAMGFELDRSFSKYVVHGWQVM